MSDCPYLLPIWFMYVYFLVWQCQKCTKSNWRDGRRRPYRHCKEIVSSFRSIGKVNVKQLHTQVNTNDYKYYSIILQQMMLLGMSIPQFLCTLYSRMNYTYTSIFIGCYLWSFGRQIHWSHHHKQIFSFSSCATNRFLVAVGVYSHCNKSQMMS